MDVELGRLESINRLCMMEAYFKQIMSQHGDVDLSFLPPELQKYSMLEGYNAEFISYVLKWQELISKEKEVVTSLNKNSENCEAALGKIDTIKKEKEELLKRVVVLELEFEKIESEIKRLEVN